MMSPKYPLYIFVNDESSFMEFTHHDEILYCEKPDILDGLYEGWDSTGRHFDLTWDESTREPRLNFTDYQEHRRHLDKLVDKASKYESECVNRGILFSSRGKSGHYPGRLCDPGELRGFIERIKMNLNKSN